MVGGIDTDGKQGICTGINTTTGSSLNPNVDARDTLDCYYKSLMAAAGFLAERRDVRLPAGKEVVSPMSS